MSSAVTHPKKIYKFSISCLQNGKQVLWYQKFCGKEKHDGKDPFHHGYDGNVHASHVHVPCCLKIWCAFHKELTDADVGGSPARDRGKLIRASLLFFENCWKENGHDRKKNQPCRPGKGFHRPNVSLPLSPVKEKQQFTLNQISMK